MATGARIEDAGGPLGRLFGEGSASGMDEGELLRRFADDRDPVALEVLVARHGPMVLGVCRRVLGDRHSSEDAFQATFLVLARRAGSIRDPGRLGPWLHGVAHRVAVRARVDLARRNARERPGAEDLAMETSADAPGFDRLELRAALDEEVRRLPEKFRDPIVLCYLDGLTHDEAATRLRCPVGTVRSRLSTGRAMLRERLARRGVTVPSGVFASVLAAEAASAAVSPALLITTVKAATAFAGGLAGATAAGMVSAELVSLAEGVSKSMILSKLKITGGLALAGLLTLGAGGVAAYQAGGAGQNAKAEKPADETPEAAIAKQKAQAEPSEATTRKLLEAKAAKLQAELDLVRAELAAAKGRPAPIDRPSTPAELRDALEVMEAQLQGKQAEMRRAEALANLTQNEAAYVKKMIEKNTVSEREGKLYDDKARADQAALEAKKAEVLEIQVRIKQARRRLEGVSTPTAPIDRPSTSASASTGQEGRTVSSTVGAGVSPNGPSSEMRIMRTMPPAPPAEPKTITTYQSNDFVIVREPRSEKLASYSTETGRWTSYDTPKGMKVVPIYSAGVVALVVRGDEIGQIATYVPEVGQWYPIDLKEPAHGEVQPIVGSSQAVYPIGRRVYAFSVPTRSWDVVELPEGATPAPIMFNNRTTVEHENHLYMFSVKTGKWTDFDVKAGQPTEPGAK